MKRNLYQLIDDYLGRLASYLPVMTASDEFYFFPRAEASISYLNRLEILREKDIEDVINLTEQALSQVNKIVVFAEKEKVDKEIFINLLKSVLREFRDQKIHQTDATLYLKLCNIAIDHAWFVAERLDLDIDEILLSRLSSIPFLLKSGQENIQEVSQPNKEIALEMVRDSIAFFDRDVRQFVRERNSHSDFLERVIEEVISSLVQYQKFIEKVSPHSSFAVGKEYLQRVLQEFYGCSKTIEEIYQIGQESYWQTIAELKSLSKKIDKNHSWQELLENYEKNWEDSEDLLDIYRQEIDKLKVFLQQKDVFDFSNDIPVIVRETPKYMRSLRAYAAYNAPINGKEDAVGVFFVTPPDDNLDPRERKKLLNTIHCDYWLVVGHEVYPGHHLLDSFRKKQKNPLRRQLENPMFYEGWAFYSEELLIEQGYVTEPLQKLIQLKYQLWRALRLLLDIDLHLGKKTIEEAGEALRKIGHLKSKAFNEARRYTQTPGYQLCYVLGKYELKRLRKKYAGKLGLKHFHNLILDSGQIPFHFLERELKKVVREN